MRVNLGCGGRPISGWVNIDKFPQSEGVVKGDVSDLSMLETDTVEEMVAYHVLEHIHPTKLDHTLKEWRRVLKPGATIAIECPNLIKCFQNLSQGIREKNEQLMSQFGLWGIYGDSKKDGDHMNHLWGFWPSYLMELLKRAGFSEVWEEVPQQKPFAAMNRDMRIVARK